MNAKNLLPIGLSVSGFVLPQFMTMPNWAVMWLYTAAMFFALKSFIMIKAGKGDWRFVLLWPGMDVRAFERRHHHQADQLPTQYALRGVGNLIAASLILVAAALSPSAGPFATTWLCIVALILSLHCGVFTLLAAFWRKAGRDVRPIMHAPLLARSVTEFWGERWNLAFSDGALQLIVRPLHRQLGRRGVVALVYVISGLAHELAISVPAGAGYGRPLAYFLIQGLVVSLEQGRPITAPWFWRLRAWIALILPLPLLVHEPFVMGVMHPFFQAIRLLP
ncbi:MAG: hypothetical protein JNJ83_17390 [Verrucomicrobiaceae bacterium]|nr:hypothetical protein [Verrucomicrobiaceae bacterium]